MADIFESQLKAAVSAIMQRDQSEPPPHQISRRADLSALRAHHERLQSEFAKARFDLSRLEKLHNEYKEETSKLFEKQIPPADSEPVKPTKSDREWTDNKKRVYELIAGRPLETFPVVIDAPAAIYSVPSGSLVDSHIESWNSWARWSHRDSRSSNWTLPDGFEVASLRFLYAWRNNAPDVAVIKSASADLSIRGQCQGIAQPPLLLDSNVDVYLYAYHRVYVGTTSLSGDRRNIVGMVAYTQSYLAGGIGDFQTEDLDLVKHVRSQDVLVPSNSVAVFDVGLEARYQIMNGEVNYVFVGSGRRIACPALVLELSLIRRG